MLADLARLLGEQGEKKEQKGPQEEKKTNAEGGGLCGSHKGRGTCSSLIRVRGGKELESRLGRVIRSPGKRVGNIRGRSSSTAEQRKWRQEVAIRAETNL